MVSAGFDICSWFVWYSWGRAEVAACSCEAVACSLRTAVLVGDCDEGILMNRAVVDRVGRVKLFKAFVAMHRRKAILSVVSSVRPAQHNSRQKLKRSMQDV